MSHTNSTTNYSLPQFIGTDKPTWLNDINGAFSAIDTQMKTNADSATSAGTSATTANNAIGTLENLNTTVKTDLVSAVNEVNTNLGTVSGVASGASSTATQAKNEADALSTYLTLTKFKTIDPANITYTQSSANGTPAIYTASNEAGTVGKLYGRISLNSNVSGGTARATFATDFRPSSALTITGAGVLIRRSANASLQNQVLPNLFMPATFTIDTSGNVTITTGDNNPSWYNTYCDFILTASIYFFTDFGDSPIPE